MARRQIIVSLVAALALTACGAGASSDREWVETPPPRPIIDETADPVPVDRVLPDGRYWGIAYEILGGDDIVFALTKARFGETCSRWASERGLTEGCMNDYAVDDATTQMLSVDDVDWVSVADPAGPGQSLRITFDTLVDLVRGEQVDMPAGRSWSPFPFVLSIEAGEVTTVEQYWVP